MHPSDRLQGQKLRDVFSLISQYKQMTKQELMDKSGLTSSTLTRILEELLGIGIISADEYGESTGGRRPIIYRVNAQYGYVFGLDISRAASKLLLCDLQMNIIEARSWPMDKQTTPEYLLPEIADEINQIMTQHHIDHRMVIGVGIGAVGPLERGEGIILNPQHFAAKGWEKVEICRILQERTGLYCQLDNGANTAILGEYWLDNDDRIQHLLYVHAGIGIRSAIIVGGEIVYGAVDMEGAAGQMVIQCGMPDVSEQLVSFRNWESYVTSPMYFGIGLANMLNILHPQKVILGGPLVSSQSQYYDQATYTALQYTYHAPAYEVIFEKSKLGEDAVAFGAAVLMVRQMTKRD